MKFLLLLLISCSTMTQGKYKKEYHLDDVKTTLAPAAAYQLLSGKMTKCYTQSDYPVFEKTISEFDQSKESGIITYDVDNQSVGRKSLVLVEVVKDEAGSIVKIYAKGDLLRTPASFKHQIHKWLDGKKVDCDSRGQI